MPKKKVTKPTFKQRVNKVKKASAKKAVAAKEGIKRTTNINRYNKYLFIFETILLVGVIDEFLEGIILSFELGIFMHILLLMASIGILFTVALQFIEKVSKGTIIWLVRLSSNKIVRVVLHLIILSLLFYLYGKVFFGKEIELVFNVGLNAN